MIADRTCGTVSFPAAGVKSRLCFAARTGHKARQTLAHRVFRVRGQRTRRQMTAHGRPPPFQGASPCLTESHTDLPDWQSSAQFRCPPPHQGLILLVRCKICGTFERFTGLGRTADPGQQVAADGIPQTVTLHR